MLSLEERLRDHDNDFTRDNLKRCIDGMDRSKAANRYNPYYKYSLQESIVNLLDKYCSSEPKFYRSLNHINKDELKRVYYGLVSFPSYAPSLIGDVISDMTDWERVAFFSGAFRDRGMIDKSRTAVEIVKRYVKSGYDFLHSEHMRKFHQGIYKRPLKVPHSQFHRKSDKPEYLRRFEKLLNDEDGTYEKAERTSIFLDSCTKTQLKKITEIYGRDILGGYAVL